jgi:hypothetical protein
MEKRMNMNRMKCSDSHGSERLTESVRRMTKEELCEHRAWLERNGGPILPPGLQEGGLWLGVIREEITKAMNASVVQVRRPPPAFLRWILSPWLRFPAKSPTA